MPIKKCTKDGKSGYKYGDNGHCYTGPDAREKAAKQGRAIEMSKHSQSSLFFGALKKLLDNDSDNTK